MSDEKLYTQEDLNNAVTKAIADMNKVLESNTNELKTLRKAYELISNELAIKNNCSSIRECSSCYVNDECHDSIWLREYYKVIADNGG